jgi:hypothetical protein
MWNIEGLVNSKLSEEHVLDIIAKFQIIGLVETWLEKGSSINWAYTISISVSEQDGLSGETYTIAENKSFLKLKKYCLTLSKLYQDCYYLIF